MKKNNFDYNYFLNQPGFIEKYNIDPDIKRYIDSYNPKNDHFDKKKSLTIDKLTNFKTTSRSFVSVLLCGGKAIRFNGQHKAVFKINNPLNDNKKLSFLGINIKQIISYENEYKVKIPIIICDDFETNKEIKKDLKDNNYYGKNKNDFIHVTNKSWFRFLPNKQMIEANNLLGKIENEEIGKLPKKPEIYKTKKIIDSVISSGHFVFNYIMVSEDFRKLIKTKPEISKIVISNCDNIGKKYFPELVEHDDVNYAVTVCRKNNEKMDGIYNFSNKIKIIQYYKETGVRSVYGFTGTIYVSIDNLIKVFGLKNRCEYLDKQKEISCLKNAFNPVIKRLDSPTGKIITLHYESSLSEISKFIDIKAILIKRDICFFPFKSINDVNEKYLDSWKKSIKKYKYIK